ncbi:YbhB/YbcL family Raf kinase inhibitor-like protein [Phenylobacterium sp.]|uniref:YbhB/YbcL family Raf kinase inhibitor-like protein n=1 Tax=Phenylobacterium sp. TaxID=1871053 RepID=UPI002DF0C182|nr:YbhB/YbcL family Raf kinase inhibitor-like protein [Phenylobacterium sp.]
MRIAAALMVFAVMAAAPAAAMTLHSGDIQPGGVVAAAQIYPRCGGSNLSPALAWAGAPKATRSFVLTMIDEDVAPHAWSHWIVVDIPPEVDHLAGGLKAPPSGARGVVSNFGAAGYAGPCPPSGSGVHHYQITVWALGEPRVEVAPDADAHDLEARLLKQSIAHASLTGSVQR